MRVCACVRMCVCVCVIVCMYLCVCVHVCVGVLIHVYTHEYYVCMGIVRVRSAARPHIYAQGGSHQCNARYGCTLAVRCVHNVFLLTAQCVYFIACVSLTLICPYLYEFVMKYATWGPTRVVYQ